MSKIVDQVKNSKIESGLDVKIIGNKRIIHFLMKYLNTSKSRIEWINAKHQPFEAVYKTNSEEIKLYIYCFSVTYLGHPHPSYKKRIQISTSADTRYLSAELNKNTCTLLIGLYTYDQENPLIVAWEPEKNRNPGKSKSCHVFTTDLLLGSINGVFQRIDSLQNSVYVFKPQYFTNFIEFYVNRKQVDNNFIIEGVETRISQLNLIYDKIKSDLENKKIWDGNTCVSEMKSFGDPNWAQSEWQGFYLEYFVKRYLNGIMQIPGPKFGNTQFDAHANIPWDFKVHSIDKKGEIPGNDIISIENAIMKYGGVGFIVILGTPIYENDREFTDWVAGLRGGLSKYQLEGEATSRKHRKRKKAFIPEKIFAFILGKADLKKQGLFQKNMKNSSGILRKEKLKIIVSKINQSNIVFQSDF